MLTPEEKRIVCGYMEWGYISPFGIQYHNFDLNDAGLCVKELVNRDEWEDFYLYFIDLKLDHMENRIADLMSTESGEAVNFFTAMAKWIEVGK